MVDIKMEPCSLVTDEQNYVLGASPDGKLILNYHLMVNLF